MPEGDTILRLARRLDAVLTGEVLCAVTSQVWEVPETRLRGRTVKAVEARGKNLLIWLDDGSALHCHLKMNGSWRVYAPGGNWSRPSAQVRLVLETQRSVAVCFNAPVLVWLPPGGAARQPRLNTLGPDLLARAVDVDQVMANLAQVSRVPLGEALLDQRVMAGVGNVYKSETLFVCRQDPFVAVGDVTAPALARVVDTAAALMRRNLGPGPRRTRPRGSGPALWVYRRSGQHCLVCGVTVEMRRQGAQARSTYYCPACQGVGG